MTCLINGSALRNAVVVTTPDDLGAFGEVQHTLHGLPDLDVAAAIVLGPDTEDVLAASDAQYKAANLLAGLVELVTNTRHEQLFPVAICDSLFQAHDPLAAALVLLVFPDRPDSLLEDVIVRDGR